MVLASMFTNCSTNSTIPAWFFLSVGILAKRNFNSLCSVRILLVCFISLWALTEFLRLPFTRHHLFSFFPSLSISQQSDLCKLHLVLSLGLFEPGFLVTLLFLLSFSIKRKDSNDTFGSAVGIVFALCLPLLFLQAYFIFYPGKTIFPEVFYSSYIVLEGTGAAHTTILCSYPFLSTIVFGVFATVYILYFLLASCKVVSLVINKGLRIRIYALLFSVLVALPTQVALLTFSTFWNPVDPVFNVFALATFLTVLMCAAVGEGILVIRPIADALAVGREFRWWGSNHERLPVVLGDKWRLAGVGGESYSYS
ncbi:hypothetical protein AQUCO_01300020v1 [Aquilegia coerulea]|uniref:Uncharacterized protein n=1 Tax=Aquilegia coerulea TaxID=218851 RepID=A0A2G5DZ52_AQUCA|nr:hypothetical protein AQUCO_01300020v1 [Aquilegia coerulea]